MYAAISIREIVKDTYSYLIENDQFRLNIKRKDQYYSAINKIYVLLANYLIVADSGPYGINQKQKIKLIKIVASKINLRFGDRGNAVKDFIFCRSGALRPLEIDNNAQALANSIIQELRTNEKYKELNLFIAEACLLVSLQEVFTKKFDERMRAKENLAVIKEQECLLISKGEYSKLIGDIKQKRLSADELRYLMLTDEQYLILAVKRIYNNASHEMLLENVFKTSSHAKLYDRSIVYLISDMCDYMNKFDRIKSEHTVEIFEVENSLNVSSFKKNA